MKIDFAPLCVNSFPSLMRLLPLKNSRWAPSNKPAVLEEVC
jgi:hypothetical protein